MANFKINLNKEESPSPEPPKRVEAPEETQASVPLQHSPQKEEAKPPTPLEQLSEPVEQKNEEKNEPKKKHKTSHKKKNKRSKKKKDAKPKSAESAYQEYRARKRIVFISLLVGLGALIVFGLYNTFLREEMTPTQAAVATNTYNGQMQNQKWDSGIQSYLNANVYVLLESKFVTSTAVKEFQVSDVYIERNQPVSDTMFLTFFDCTITVNGNSERLFCYIFITTENNNMQAASDVTITARESFTSQAEKTKKNAIIDFDEKDIDDNLSKSFQTVLDNFLTLGYNMHQDTSNIYKGSAPLSWHGEYQRINECHVYKNANELGFNAKATYVVEEENGFTYTNTCYLTVEKQDKDTWIIKQIM